MKIYYVVLSTEIKSEYYNSQENAEERQSELKAIGYLNVIVYKTIYNPKEK